MASVTECIAKTKQPRGGYLNPKQFEQIHIQDNYFLKEENIHPSIVGLVVDYMTRFLLGKDIIEAFKISIMGAIICNEQNNALKLLKNIQCLDEKSIIAASKLVSYDICFRNGPEYFHGTNHINPDIETINNIIILIKRSISFFEKYGPVTKDGFTFEGGYSNVITSGDGDFLTEDTLWDFKVSKMPPTSKHTLQLLIYYIMGKHSIYEYFDNINKLGIFNPRLNNIYTIEINSIPKNIIDDVSKNIIGYT